MIRRGERENKAVISLLIDYGGNFVLLTHVIPKKVAKIVLDQNCGSGGTWTEISDLPDEYRRCISGFCISSFWWR